MNLNKWGVIPTSIPNHIDTVIGKPLVLYKNTGTEPDAFQRKQGAYDHPSLNDKDMNHALAYQDLFRIGTYIDVVKDPHKQDWWWGIAEITDENVKRAIKEDPKIPFYVSPTIAVIPGNKPQADNAIENWTFMHTAIVSEPAYTVHKAYIGGQCSGTSDQCLLQLRRASLAANNGKPTCGFCTYEAMKSLQQNMLETTSNPTHAEHVVSSQVTTTQQNVLDNNIMVESNNQNSSPQTPQQTVNSPSVPNVAVPTTDPKVFSAEDNNNNKAQENNNKAETQQQQSQQQQEQSKPTVTEVKKEEVKKVEGSTNNNSTELVETIQRQASIIKDLEMKLNTAKADNETSKSLIEQYSSRLSKLEEHIQAEQKSARLKKITNIVQNSRLYAGLSPEERQKQIDMFANGSMKEDEIEAHIAPLEASFRSASTNNYVSKLNTSYSSSNNSNPVSAAVDQEAAIQAKSASVNNNNNSEAGLSNIYKIHNYRKSLAADFTNDGGIA